MRVRGDAPEAASTASLGTADHHGGAEGPDGGPSAALAQTSIVPLPPWVDPATRHGAGLELAADRALGAKLAEIEVADLTELVQETNTLRKRFDVLHRQCDEKEARFHELLAQITAVQTAVARQHKSEEEHVSVLEEAQHRYDEAAEAFGAASDQAARYQHMASRLADEVSLVDGACIELREELASLHARSEEQMLHLTAAVQEKKKAEDTVVALTAQLLHARESRTTRIAALDTAITGRSERLAARHARELRLAEMSTWGQPPDLGADQEQRLVQLYEVRKAYRRMLVLKLEAETQRADELEVALGRVRTAAGVPVPDSAASKTAGDADGVTSATSTRKRTLSRSRSSGEQTVPGRWNVDLAIEKFHRRNEPFEQLQVQANQVRDKIAVLRTDNKNLRRMLDAESLGNSSLVQRQVYQQIEGVENKLFESRKSADYLGERAQKVKLVLRDALVTVSKLLRNMTFDLVDAVREGGGTLHPTEHESGLAGLLGRGMAAGGKIGTRLTAVVDEAMERQGELALALASEDADGDDAHGGVSAETAKHALQVIDRRLTQYLALIAAVFENEELVLEGKGGFTATTNYGKSPAAAAGGARGSPSPQAGRRSALSARSAMSGYSGSGTSSPTPGEDDGPARRGITVSGPVRRLSTDAQRAVLHVAAAATSAATKPKNHPLRTFPRLNSFGPGSMGGAALGGAVAKASGAAGSGADASGAAAGSGAAGAGGIAAAQLAIAAMGAGNELSGAEQTALQNLTGKAQRRVASALFAVPEDKSDANVRVRPPSPPMHVGPRIVGSPEPDMSPKHGEKRKGVSFGIDVDGAGGNRGGDSGGSIWDDDDDDAPGATGSKSQAMLSVAPSGGARSVDGATVASQISGGGVKGGGSGAGAGLSLRSVVVDRARAKRLSKMVVERRSSSRQSRRGKGK